jgi:sigma-E factor negative regulatory protein RseC
VVVGLAEEAMLKGSVLVYLLPLLAMIGFALLADSLIAADTASRDLLVLIAALAGFSLMLVISRLLLSTGSNSSKLTPVVLRKNIA